MHSAPIYRSSDIPARAAKVRYESAERFGRPRANVEAAIKRFFAAA